MLTAKLQGTGNHGEQLVIAQYTICHLTDLWCNAMKLEYADYTAKPFRGAGHTMEHVAYASYFATRPNDLACNGMHVNDAGWSADKLKHVGCIIEELQDAGNNGKHIANAEQKHACGSPSMYKL